MLTSTVVALWQAKKEKLRPPRRCKKRFVTRHWQQVNWKHGLILHQWRKSKQKPWRRERNSSVNKRCRKQKYCKLSNRLLLLSSNSKYQRLDYDPRTKSKDATPRACSKGKTMSRQWQCSNWQPFSMSADHSFIWEGGALGGGLLTSRQWARLFDRCQSVVVGN